MSGQEERSEALKGLEAALAALAPRVEGFDRERLIFEAGRAAAMAEIERAQSPGAAPARALSAGPVAETPAHALSEVYDRRLRQRALMHGIDLWAEPAMPQRSGVQVTAKAPSSVLQLEREWMEQSAPGGRFGPCAAPRWFSLFGDRT